MSKDTSGRKHGSAGGDASGEASSWWHRYACRVFLHFEHTDKANKGNERLQLVADHLNILGVRNKAGHQLTVETVDAAIRARRKDKIFQAIKEMYAGHPEDLIATDVESSEREIWLEKLNAGKVAGLEDYKSANDIDGSLAAAAERFENSRGAPKALDYWKIAARAEIRLRAVIGEAKLQWASLQAVSAADDILVADFPEAVIIARAFAR
jgi:hypothetical protein